MAVFIQVVRWLLFVACISVGFSAPAGEVKSLQSEKAAAKKRFVMMTITEPRGMKIAYEVKAGVFSTKAVEPPHSYKLVPGVKYRFRVTDIPGRDGMILLPRISVWPVHPVVEEYVKGNSIPVELTDADLEAIERGRLLTKVYYSSGPKYRELFEESINASLGTRLFPGIDPIAEADRMGTIHLVLRIGSRDQQPPKAGRGAMNVIVPVQ